MLRVIVSMFLVFGFAYVAVPTHAYAISLDDDEEDAEDVADLVQQAKQAADSESFDRAQKLLKQAKQYGVEGDEVSVAKQYAKRRKKEHEHRVKVTKVAKLLKQAKAAADSESFDQADTLITKATGYGVSTDAVKQTRSYIAQKRQEREERLAAAQRQAEAYEAQQSSLYIVNSGMRPFDPGRDTVWGRDSVKLSDGSQVMVRMTKSQYSCYQINVVRHGRGFGTCSYCGDEPGKSWAAWSCSNNQYERFNFQGNYASAFEELIHRGVP